MSISGKRLGSILVTLWIVIGSVSFAAFNDVTSETGISYLYSKVGDPVENHAGAAAIDVDGDGWTDVIVARYEQRPLLYINQRNGSFLEEGIARGFGDAIDASSFGAGDFDNDGDQDLFIAPHDKNRCWLFINDGQGVFSEESIVRGADLTTSINNHNGYSVGLVDYDLDGFLDIYLSEWGVLSSAENRLHSALLRNQGEANPAHFELATQTAGLVQPASGGPQQHGFSSAWGDFDQDGWPDLALVADFSLSKMYWNNGDGTFLETGEASGVGKDEFGMGVAVADYDMDGLLDFYVTSIYDTISFERDGTHTGNKLYRNLGGRLFQESAEEAGLSKTGWGWGTSFFEYDNDGDPDLVATNGSNISIGGNPETTPFVPAASDPTELYLNDGSGVFSNETSSSGIADNDLGKAILVFDYDNDGDEDLLITNTLTEPVIYESDASTTSNRWIRFAFEGLTSNRDGYGAIVTVKDGDHSQVSLYNPTNAYIGQREAILHFGLGAAGENLDEVLILWPSGIRQKIEDLATNQVHLLVEPEVQPSIPSISKQPEGGVFEKDQDVELTIIAAVSPTPIYIWEKDGEVIAGANEPTLEIERIQPFDAGEYRVRVINSNGEVISDPVTVDVVMDFSGKSIARIWNEFLLEAIRKDFPAPTIHSRNLFHTSAAFWDAFWAYEPESWTKAVPIYIQEDIQPADWQGDREESQKEAISYAAYRILTERYQTSPGAERSLFAFDWLMEQLGYDPGFLGASGNSPAAVGNCIGFGILTATLNDGSNETNEYLDTSGYQPSNEPLVLALSGTEMQAPNLWQPLAFDFRITQNGIPIGEDVQTFIGVNWREVDTFAIEKPTQTTIALDPGPPPLLGSESESAFLDSAIEVIRYSSTLDPQKAAMIDISPGGRLNNRLGTNNGTGRPLNPTTDLPYEPNLVNQADYGRILAEFWADGPASETPPGHWNALHNEIADHPAFQRRYAGQGSELSRLEWDVQAYLALNGAMHDAAIAAWTLKRQYDYVRPISIIRYLGSLGQSSDPNRPSYHPQGLPLEDGLVEVITAESSTSGERHAHLSGYIGEVAIYSWAGEPADKENQIGGVQWIRAVDWVPYQRSTFVTPAFAAYVSGHSAFSRAGAEALTLLTGSPYFPGGMGEFHFEADEFLEFEQGPSEDVTLQWATYYDAADQAGLSRLYGGIHVRADDFAGRILGAQVGVEAFLKAHWHRHGSAKELGLVNISTRAQVGTGDDVMIAGFVIDRSEPSEMLVRSIGPGLENQGIQDFITDPKLTLLVPSQSEELMENDNWDSSPQATRIAAKALEEGAFSLSQNSLDAAEVALLEPGIYATLTQSSSGAAGGVGLTEVYGEGLSNISTRARVGSNNQTLIAGFVVEGHDPSVLLIRGVGPSLAGQGVEDYLLDPVIAIYKKMPDQSFELIASNDDWQADDTASLSEATAKKIGAFALAEDSKDAAKVIQASAGIYAVTVSSATSSTGLALVEVYLVR